MPHMIRVIRRPDGTREYECETQHDLETVQRVLDNGQAPATSHSPAPVGAAEAARLTLDDGPRKILTALLSVEKIDGEELRKEVDLDTKELGRTMLLLSNQLQQKTGKRLTDYVKITRTFKEGERIKVYKRTKPGEKLMREL